MDQCPETNSEDSAQPCQFLKEKKKKKMGEESQ